MSLRQARERFGSESDCMDTMESMTRMEKEWFLLGSCLRTVRAPLVVKFEESRLQLQNNVHLWA